MDNLIFFDKEGHSLNYNYNTSLNRYEGDMIFHENSNDTYKTQAIYMFEKIDAFEYDNPPDLTLKKWQLFNEFGMNFYSSKYTLEEIERIEPVNVEPDYYSKWIYGREFHRKFPIGTVLRFDNSIFEFNNTNQTYVVVSVKRGAIMVLSFMDNQTFDATYNWGLTSSYAGETISSMNIIGIYDYIDSTTLQEKLSSWNEPDFYDRLYVDRKINIVNTSNNDNYSNVSNRDYEDVEVVTVENTNVLDIVHYEYHISDTQFFGGDIEIEVLTKTDLPLIYQDGLQFFDSSTPNTQGFTNVLDFSQVIPTILKPGTQFKVINSTLNTSYIKIDDISDFVGNSNLINYVPGDQVIWNSEIYQCVTAHTWNATSSITPDSATFWGNPTYLPIVESVSNETIVSGDIYLSTDVISFTHSFTFSNVVTLASVAERYSDELVNLNIDLYYDYDTNRLVADLIYPTQYAIVNFYSSLLPGTAIGGNSQIYERAIEVEETLTREFNKDISENFSYNLVFTDIDEYGIYIKINGEIYQEEVEFIYSGGQIDMERTIDKTLRNWLTRHSVTLILLGIIPSLQTIGFFSPYYNSINLRTFYPNVPLDFEVRVGTTANFYIEHSHLTFFDPSGEGVTPGLGNYIDIVINGRSYGIAHVTPNIATTLQNWVDEYSTILDDFGIYVENVASTLKFSIKEQLQRCDIEVRPGLNTLPGDFNYKLAKKFSGNHGALLTSNEVLLGTQSATQSQYQSLENAGFATGMVVGVNGTVYPLQNVEFNSLFLDPEVMNLSYEGPFWGLTGSLCDQSPFVTVAFNIGFGQTACPPSFGTGPLGMFNPLQFNNSFSITYQNTTTYSVNTYNTTSYLTGTGSMVDILYVQPSSSMMVLGDDILVYDSTDASYVDVVELVGNTSSISLEFNQYDNYVYVLSNQAIYQVDPYTNTLINSTTHSGAYSMAINSDNGDVYVTTDTSTLIYSNMSLVQTISGSSYNLVYNSFEGDMYVTRRDGLTVTRIDGNSRTVQDTYTVVGLTDDTLVYDPVNEAVYVFGGANLYKIDAGVVTSIPLVSTGAFNDMVFNNLTDVVNISNDDPSFSALGVSDDTYDYNQSVAAWGYQVVNYYDGDVYISNQDPLSASINIYDTDSGSLKEIIPLPVGDNTTRLEYDPDRNSVWFIQPTLQTVIEVVPTLGVSLIPTITGPSLAVTESHYGSLDPNYIERDYLWLHTRDYIRRPRSNFNGDVPVTLYWKWFSDNVPEFFLYDFSGDQLTTDGALAYRGDTPLDTVRLNTVPNRDIERIREPEYQQTVFDQIDHTLDYIDDNDDFSTVPEPIETFIGFNSEDEGALRSILQLYMSENIDFTFDVSLDSTNIITIEHVEDVITGERYGKISLDTMSNDIFLTDSNGDTRGLKPGQHMAIFITDISNTRNQYISENSGYLLKIRNVYSREIIFDYFKDVDQLVDETNIISDYPGDGDITYLSVRFAVWDREIGRFNTYGQTEVEDVRYKIELGNVGKLVPSDDVYIYKEYDIKEEGIDWVYLNKKRKEMLLMKHLIYPYIGAYKSIINAINHFGYNDLELYEYYRDVNVLSENYKKLYKVEIPDIFDNDVEGWTEGDFLNHTFPNENYEETRLFNLTYRITDREGNNILTYTLEEVQKKLQGLKYWLQSNIIPLTHEILDITGRADFVGGAWISHDMKDINIIKIREDLNPVSFKLNETNLMPVNNGSTVYNCVLDFYLGEPFGTTQSFDPDYYTIDIRTYELYREWYPLKTYSGGERIIYLDTLYESTISGNKANNPRKYENVPIWEEGTFYNVADIVKWDRDYYAYSAWGITQSSSTASFIAPSIDSGTTASNWVNVTEWREFDMRPIQKITERRLIGNLNPYNFTIDSNIDPFLVIEVTSENGYGAVYRDKKNYEIRGILDIQELEAFTNLTSKQYIDATLGITYVNNGTSI